MDVSIVIVNYNTCSMTKECIDSVFDRTREIIFEVILVDNASSDASFDIFSKDKRITYIYNKENVGFGRANNIGIGLSKGRNVLFLNSDTLLFDNSIKKMSDCLDGNIFVGACGGNLFNKQGNPSHSFGRFYPSILSELNMLLYGFIGWILYGKNRDYNYTKKCLKVAHIIGADLMVKRQVLDIVGSFNPAFFMYREETELCYRINRAGFLLYSIPSVKIMHLEGGTVDNEIAEYQKIKWKLASNKLFIEMYHSKFYSRCVSYLQLLIAISRKCLCVFVRKDRKEYWNFVYEYLKKEKI